MNQATFDYVPDEAESQTQPKQQAQEPVTEQTAETGTELVTMKDLAIAEIFRPGGSDKILDDIEKQAESIITDITTEKGRKEIASMAYKIARTKTAFDEQGKKLKDQHQQIVNEVDSERRKIRSRLDTLKEKVRAPLTEFEEREKIRVQTRENTIVEINRTTMFDHPDPQASLIQERINKINSLYQLDWQEFAEKAKEAYDKNKKLLEDMLESRTKRDAEAAELERLRKAEEERKQKEREEQVAKEAAEKARKEAEEKAAKEKAEAEAAAKAEQERLQKEKKDAEEKAKAEKERLEREAKEAAERAEREKKEAVEAERKRQEDEKRKAEAERQKREADKAHKGKINRAAVSAIANLLEAVNDDYESSAQALVDAISSGKIPHVKIEY